MKRKGGMKISWLDVIRGYLILYFGGAVIMAVSAIEDLCSGIVKRLKKGKADSNKR